MTSEASDLIYRRLAILQLAYSRPLKRLHTDGAQEQYNEKLKNLSEHQGTIKSNKAPHSSAKKRLRRATNMYSVISREIRAESGTRTTQRKQILVVCCPRRHRQGKLSADETKQSFHHRYTPKCSYMGSKQTPRKDHTTLCLLGRPAGQSTFQKTRRSQRTEQKRQIPYVVWITTTTRYTKETRNITKIRISEFVLVVNEIKQNERNETAKQHEKDNGGAA